jgi:hypothetical protein
MSDLQTRIDNLEMECNEWKRIVDAMTEERDELKAEVKLQEGLVKFWIEQARVRVPGAFRSKG